MHLRAAAIVLAVRPHGEHGAIVRALTRDDGVQPGYVRGGTVARGCGRCCSPPTPCWANGARGPSEQLAALTVELIHSRARSTPSRWPPPRSTGSTALTAAALPEAQAYPRVHDGARRRARRDRGGAGGARLGGGAGALRAAAARRAGLRARPRRCVATGAADDLAFVSPKSGGAVSRAAATGYEARLLPLPRVPARRRGGGLGRHLRRAGADRPFPRARPADRPRAPTRWPRASGWSTG